jgi:hypothetical protein
MGEQVEKLKQRWPLLDYQQQQNWVAQPTGYDSEFVGLCPLHEETRPSFYANARKNLFYGIKGRAPRSLSRQQGTLHPDVAAAGHLAFSAMQLVGCCRPAFLVAGRRTPAGGTAAGNLLG